MNLSVLDFRHFERCNLILRCRHNCLWFNFRWIHDRNTFLFFIILASYTILTTINCIKTTYFFFLHQVAIFLLFLLVLVIDWIKEGFIMSLVLLRWLFGFINYVYILLHWSDCWQALPLLILLRFWYVILFINIWVFYRIRLLINH